MTESLRWAVIGASWIAGDRVIPALRRAGQTVSALVTGSGAHGAGFAEAHGIPKTVASIDELDPSAVDAVYIGNHNAMHRPSAEAAAAKGWHVLVEKPMAAVPADARAIVDACAAAGVTLAVNHHLVASGAVQRVRALIDEGAVGQVRAVRVQHAKMLPEFLRTWRLGDAPGAGVIPDLTPHDASVLFALVGPRRVERVEAIAVKQSAWAGEAADAAVAIVLLEGGVVVTLHDGFTTPHARAGVEVLGSTGSIWAADLVDPDPVATITLSDSSGSRAVEWDAADVYESTVRAFVAATAGEGAPHVDGEAGLRAAALAFAVEEAAARPGV